MQMKYWLLLIFFLSYTINVQAAFIALPSDYQVVVKKINTISSSTFGLVNIYKQSSDSLESQYIDKRHFSMIAFLLMLGIGLLYLQYKENAFSKQLNGA